MHIPTSMPIPRQWPSSVKSAFIHAVSLASAVFTCSCVLSAKRKSRDTRQNAELAQAYQENQLLREELAIKDERIQRIAPHRRPQYSPIQRMRILSLQAARRWSLSQTADAFHLSIQTLILWKKRLDEEGRNALIQVPEPVNKFPDFVRSIVRQMKALFPGWARSRLLRCSLELGFISVRRLLVGCSMTARRRPRTMSMWMPLTRNPRSPASSLPGTRATSGISISRRCLSHPVSGCPGSRSLSSLPGPFAGGSPWFWTTSRERSSDSRYSSRSRRPGKSVNFLVELPRKRASRQGI